MLLGRCVRFADPGDRIFDQLFKDSKFYSLHFLFKNNLCGDLSPKKVWNLWEAGCATKSNRIALQLLSQGLDPTQPDLLKSAIFYGREDLVQILVQKGASLDRPEDPPYHECLTGEMAVWLIKHYGADPFVANQKGQVLCQVKCELKKDFLLLWQRNTEGEECETTLSKKYAGRFRHFLWTEEDFAAVKDYWKKRPCNLLELAFLLGNAPLVKELKARYPEYIEGWVEELKKVYPERSLAALLQFQKKELFL